MADNKKDEKATQPAPHAEATEVSTRDDQYSTGPAGVGGDEEDPNATKTYYLRDGATHLHIEKGEPRTLNRFGQKASLTESQYKSFKDKFYTEAEFKGVKAGKEAALEAAAAETLLDGSTSENPTPEERNAENNEPASGKANPAGVPAKPVDDPSKSGAKSGNTQ